MLIAIQKDKDRILSGSINQMIVLGKRGPREGDRLEFWENPRKKDKSLLGVALCDSAKKITIDPTLNTVYIDYERLDQSALEVLAKSDGYPTVEAFWDSFKSLNAVTGFLIQWSPGYLNKSRLLPNVKKQGDFLTDSVSPIEHAQPATDREKLEFTYAWCQFCKRAGKCPVQESPTEKARHLVGHEGAIACTVFIPSRAQKWEIDRRHFLELEKRGQLNLLEKYGEA